MDSMPDGGMSIEEAKKILHEHRNLPATDKGLPSPELHQAIASVLATSRLTGHRDKISDEELFSDVLSFFLYLDKVYSWGTIPPLTITTLKCLGNLLADNDANRDYLINDRQTPLLLRTYVGSEFDEGEGSKDQWAESATLGVKVVYNLCRGYEPAQVNCLKIGMADALFVYTRKSNTLAEDDARELALELLGDLGQHLEELPAHLTPHARLVHGLLQLVLDCDEDVDLDAFDNRATAISPWMADSKTQQTILQDGCILKALRVLDHTIFLTTNSPQPEQGKAFASVLLHSLTAISALDDFPNHLSDILPTLAPRCILHDTDADVTPSVCAAILLGNAATTPANALSILKELDLPRLNSTLTLHAYARSKPIPGERDYLHAALGMLRLLARHDEARAQMADVLRVAAALAKRDDADVAGAALRLFRVFQPKWVEAKPYVGMLGRVWANVPGGQAGDQVRLELARTAAGLVKAWAGRDPSAAAENISVGDTGTNQTTTEAPAPWLLDALCFAAGVPGVPLANAEGFLGLVLLPRADVAAKLASDEALFGAVAKTIGPGKESDQMVPNADLAARARDNALVLCREMLRFEGLEEKVREELDRVVGEAGVTLPLR